MYRECRGWVLSLYPDEADGAVVWLLAENGERLRLKQQFDTVFYVSGELPRLEAMRKSLLHLDQPPVMGYEERRDLYQGMTRVLAIQVSNPVAQQRLFQRLKKEFKRVQYYNAQIPFPIRYGVARGVYPMARCRLLVDEARQIIEIEALDSMWDVEYDLPPLRTLTIQPDVDPRHARPRQLLLQSADAMARLSTEDEASLLIELQSILETGDPDVILASWGDGWLFPYLAEIAAKYRVDFNPSRDERQKTYTIRAMTFESYGSVYHRAAQTHLFGRWHIDPKNSTMDMGFNFSLRSAIEMARVTGVSVQTAARNSPGSGFTAMQIREALQRGILVPLHKRQTERFKSAMALNLADAGGLNYRPVVGVHRHVAELDFFSMYPSIMAKWNISGETVGVSGGCTLLTPDTGVPITQDVDGLVASVLRPLLAKRFVVKGELKSLEKDDPRRPVLQSIADALKWLGYVSFGYQGYKNNLFGNIQAHEAICAIGRETLVTAIETAHEMGFRVLGANVDSLFVQKEGLTRPQDFQPLVDEICRRSELILEMEGVYSWLIFPASRLNPFVGASNRYYGKLADGRQKVRGMAQRRSDTPNWIAEAEGEIMRLLSEVSEEERFEDCIPEIIQITRRYFAELDAGRVALKDLASANKLSREIDEYTGCSPAASAAAQLAGAGKKVRVGERVRFIYTHGGKTSVCAWDRPEGIEDSAISKKRYKELLLRAVFQILVSLGLDEKTLCTLVYENVRQLELWPEKGRGEPGSSVPEDEISLADILFGPFTWKVLRRMRGHPCGSDYRSSIYSGQATAID